MEKRGLGKGLGALIPGAEEIEKMNGTEIDIESISLNPYQPRVTIDEEKLQDLVNSVRVVGVLQPIVVRSKGEGKYELVAGERRLRAATKSGLKKIPAIIRELTDEQSLQVALIENIQREDINPIDAASAYRRLMDEFRLSQEDLAFSIGKNRSTIANTLRLLNLPEKVMQEIKAGRISEGHARAILSLEDAKSQQELSTRIVNAGLSVRDAERMAREWSKRQGSFKENVSRETLIENTDPNILEIEARLRVIYGTKVTLSRSNGRGRIAIDFYSDDDLERILSLLAGF